MLMMMIMMMYHMDNFVPNYTPIMRRKDKKGLFHLDGCRVLMTTYVIYVYLYNIYMTNVLFDDKKTELETEHDENHNRVKRKHRTELREKPNNSSSRYCFLR